MRTISFAALPLIAALAVASSAVAAAPSQTAAIVAVKQAMAKVSGQKVWRSGRLSCYHPGGSPSGYFCDSPLVHSVVVFRGGVPSINLLLCKSGHTTTARACR